MVGRRFGSELFATAAVGCALAACGSDGDMGGRDGNLLTPSDMIAGTGGASSTAGTASLPIAGNAAAGQGGASALGGSGGAAAGSGGGSGAAGMASAAGTGGAGGAGMDGVEPGDVQLTTLAANGTIGLDWSRVRGATGYRLYWSNTAGVTPQSGTAIDIAEPAYVHRGLENGSAYHYVVTAVLPGGEGPASPEASAMPQGEWVLEHLGTGDFDDVLTGERVPRVPIDKRVQVFLLPEGYLQGELAGFHDHATHGAGSNDVDRWQAEVFALEPYSMFKDAFVIWYLPRASAAHAGEGDTAFDVTVSNGGVTGASNVATPLFAVLDDQGSDAFAFAPGTAQPVNFVASFMLLDPERGRAGWSGMMTSVRNPNVQNQSIRAAFGVGHAHEFTHAFARVSDEYMETSNGAPRDSSPTSNVAASNSCDALPWAHLLAGRGINETEGLVGAFGTPELGYHSELLCLMNGTHDNGQFWCEEGDQRYTTLTLRPDRLCNFCREVAAFRVFERTGLLSGMGAFETWASMYRPVFYDRFEFVVPEGPIPQTVTCNQGGPAKPVYEACMP
jgi:hypothetical protein